MLVWVCVCARRCLSDLERKKTTVWYFFFLFRSFEQSLINPCTVNIPSVVCETHIHTLSHTKFLGKRACVCVTYDGRAVIACTHSLTLSIYKFSKYLQYQLIYWLQISLAFDFAKNLDFGSFLNLAWCHDFQKFPNESFEKFCISLLSQLLEVNIFYNNFSF